MDSTATASLIQKLGAGGFGFLIGWYIYYINRHRKGDVKMSDLVTLIGVVGGASVTALFPQRSDLFGSYGLGLFAGFFTYFVVLAVLVARSPNFTADWFLDGRRKAPEAGFIIPEGSRPPMDIQFDPRPGARASDSPAPHSSAAPVR